MVIKEGYKQTEIGLIPHDWEMRTLGELSQLITKGTTPKRFTDSGINYIKIESLKGDNISIEKCLFIDEITNITELKRSILNEGDILFAIAGATIGKCTIVPKEIVPANTNQALAIIRLKEKVNKKFVFYFLKSKLMQKYIVDNIAGGAQPNMNLAQVGGYYFPIPSTFTEQTAIATALSDADGLITGLEKLIAKKRNIKQGAMQQLLQPKEGWEVKKLGEISQIYTGKKNNQDKVENGKYPFFVRSKTIETINSYSFEGEAILIPGEGNIGSIFHYINGKFDYHQRVYKISDFNDKYSGKYIYRYITEHFGKHAMQNSVKATVDSLRLPTFQVFEIPFPPSKEEQTRIATILADMDAELSALEQKLEKYKKVKLGMMQELLTGKTRLN